MANVGLGFDTNEIVTRSTNYGFSSTSLSRSITEGLFTFFKSEYNGRVVRRRREISTTRRVPELLVLKTLDTVGKLEPRLVTSCLVDVECGADDEHVVVTKTRNGRAAKYNPDFINNKNQLQSGTRYGQTSKKTAIVNDLKSNTFHPERRINGK